jgi:hypothetical protein
VTTANLALLNVSFSSLTFEDFSSRFKSYTSFLCDEGNGTIITSRQIQ